MALFQKLSLFKTIKFSELTSFTRQFSAMLEAKISLVRILEILVLQTENQQLKKILQDVKKKVQGGAALADALGRYPQTFSTFYISMVRVDVQGF